MGRSLHSAHVYCHTTPDAHHILRSELPGDGAHSVVGGYDPVGEFLGLLVLELLLDGADVIKRTCRTASTAR